MDEITEEPLDSGLAALGRDRRSSGTHCGLGGQGSVAKGAVAAVSGNLAGALRGCPGNAGHLGRITCSFQDLPDITYRASESLPASLEVVQSRRLAHGLRCHLEGSRADGAEGADKAPGMPAPPVCPVPGGPALRTAGLSKYPIVGQLMIIGSSTMHAAAPTSARARNSPRVLMPARVMMS